MDVVICGSMNFKEKMREVGRNLKEAGFRVTIPQGARDPEVKAEDKRNEFKYYFSEIVLADAVVVLNETKTTPEGKMLAGYVGGNTFLEMGFAYVLSKPIVLCYPPLRELPYIDEIDRMNPIILEKPGEETLIHKLNAISKGLAG